MRAAPTPSRDIKQRLKVYLNELARPKITGISAGEKLRIIWPGARETISGPSEFSAETLPLFALLFRDQMLDSLLAEVERMSNTPLPAQKRAERMKVLSEEIDRLQRVGRCWFLAKARSARPTARQQRCLVCRWPTRTAFAPA